MESGLYKGSLSAIVMVLLYFARRLVLKTRTSQPIRCYNKSNCDLASRVLPRSLLVLSLCSHWLLVISSFAVIGLSNLSAVGFIALNREVLFFYN